MKFFYCVVSKNGEEILSVHKTEEEAKKQSLRVVEIMAERIADCYHVELNEEDDDYTVLYNAKTHAYTTI